MFERGAQTLASFLPDAPTLLGYAKGSIRLGSVQLLLVVAAIGVLLLYLWPKWGRRWIATAALAYWFVCSPLGSSLLVKPLAGDFHPIAEARDAGLVPAIVVLGGGTDEVRARADVIAYPYSPTALRTLEAVRLFRLLDGRPYILASGGANRRRRVTEAEVMAESLVKLGVPRERILFDPISMTTHEQAINVTGILRAHGINRFILVTWPTHLPRAMAVFRAQRAEVIPSAAPLDTEGASKYPFFVPNNHSMLLSDEAMWEYLGYAYYWARGWLKPVPEPAR